MPLASRLEDEASRLGLNHIRPELRTHDSLDHIAVLILPRVPVQRSRERTRRDWMFDDGERALCLRGTRQEASAEATEVDESGRFWSDNLRRHRVAKRIQGLGGHARHVDGGSDCT